MSEEVKPCPFCGGIAIQTTVKYQGFPEDDAASCHCLDINYKRFPVRSWQNAYCWKELAKRDERIASMCPAIDSLIKTFEFMISYMNQVEGDSFVTEELVKALSAAKALREKGDTGAV